MIDLSWITPSLAVGGSFPSSFAEELARAHAIAAVVDLRAEARHEELRGLELLHLPTEDLCAISLRHLCKGVAFVARHLDANGRVLVHCAHGIGRSALLALCVLVERGYSPLDALALAKARRAKISPSPAQYEAWASWLRARGDEPPAFDEFAVIAYRGIDAGLR